MISCNGNFLPPGALLLLVYWSGQIIEKYFIILIISLESCYFEKAKIILLLTIITSLTLLLLLMLATVVTKKEARLTEEEVLLSGFYRYAVLLAVTFPLAAAACLIPYYCGNPATSYYDGTNSSGVSADDDNKTEPILVEEPLCADGMCYYMPTAFGTFDYEGAQKHCEGSEMHGGGWTLASIHTKAQNDTVVSLFSGIDTKAWIGLDRLGGEEYEWVDGTTFKRFYFRNWATDQPDSTGQEKCGAINSANGVWDDLHCDGRDGLLFPVCSRQDADAIVEPQCVDGMCYYIPTTFEAVGYVGAKEHCGGSEVDGGDWTLASFHTRAQIALVVSLADGYSTRNPIMWIGLDRLASDEYEWVDGSLTAGYFKNWVEHHADMEGKDDEECLAMLALTGGATLEAIWRERRCDGSQDQYISVCSRPDDINECEGDHPCAHTCVSTHGNFHHCQCDEGFVLGDDGFECFDIDECAGDHGCDHTCINTVGSFQCECEEGYTNNFEGSDGFECLLDVDECQDDNGGCAHTCINTVPGFHCECNDGFVKGDDGFECLVDMCYSGDVVSELRITTSGEGGLAWKLDGFFPRFGSSMTVVGDVDGDGVADLAVGAILDDDGGWDRGAVYIIFLNADGSVKAQQKISATAGGLVGPLDDEDIFGRSVAGVGDVDGDGVLDLAVGVMQDGDGGKARGAVYILFLNTDGTVKAEQKISSTQGGLVGPLDDGDKFGRSVAAAGDLNGDGVVDIVVGSPWDGEGGGPGALYVLFLNDDGTVKAEQKIGSSKHDELVGRWANVDRFGVSVVAVGDVDGDGMVDLAVGAAWDNEGGWNRGAVYILFLNMNGTVKGEQKISSTQGGLVGPLDDDDYFGVSVAAVGDMDGDGVPDLAVGASKDDDGGGPEQGAVYILLLNRDGTVKRGRKISSTQGGLEGPLGSTGRFGFSVAVLGDLDGDGVITLAVSGSSKRTYIENAAVYMIEVPHGFVPVCAADETCANRGGGTYDCTAV